jgi:hypothetical protein
MLPAVIVIAVSAVAAIAIVAWLVRQIALKAIEKVSPEGVAPVIMALSALPSPFRLFLPWSGPEPGPKVERPSDLPGLPGEFGRDQSKEA